MLFFYDSDSVKKEVRLTVMKLPVEDIAAIKHHFGQFDAPAGATYCWDCEAYATQPRVSKQMQSIAEFIAVGDPLSIVLKQINNVLDYIILLRGKFMRLRAEKLLEALVLILNMNVSTADKAQLIRNQWMDWGTWMQAIRPGPDSLRDECCALGADLIQDLYSSDLKELAKHPFLETTGA